MNDTSFTKLNEGLFVETYNRRILFALVRHLASFRVLDDRVASIMGILPV